MGSRRLNLAANPSQQAEKALSLFHNNKVSFITPTYTRGWRRRLLSAASLRHLSICTTFSYDPVTGLGLGSSEEGYRQDLSRIDEVDEWQKAGLESAVRFLWR
ncbi:hypothetical protein QYF36_006529 [Acer negundo]|nr:hypothetical protein QYF36_006529 [Acer negundo]